MLHHKTFVCLLNGFGDQCTFDVAAVDKIILIVTVSSGNYWFSNKTTKLKQFGLMFYFQNRGRNISSINMVNEVFFISIS